MKKCQYCNAENAVHAMYCEKCELLIGDVYTPPVEESVEKDMNCLRCEEVKMICIGEQKLQRGSTVSNLFFNDIGPLIHGQLKVEAYQCPNCHRLEFFSQNLIKTETGR